MAARFYSFHEQVRQGDAMEHVMCTHALVTVVQLKIEESENIFMEYIKINSYSTFTCAQLVYTDCCIVQLANPRDYTGACVLVATDIRTTCPYFSEVNADAAAHFAKTCYVCIGVKDTL